MLAPSMAKTSRQIVMLGVLLLACFCVGAPAEPSAIPNIGSSPPCFGAAARDPTHPCNNPRLRLTVQPTPSQAQITPNTPCTPIKATINVCTFGVPAAQAASTIALIGDSHTWHWRGAVEVVAQALDWQGLSSTRSSCPFTQGMTILPEPKRAGCTKWNRDVLRWVGQHPEISTVVTSDHPGPVVASRGQSPLAAQVAGYLAAWNALPPTVKHVIVIRDIPYMHEGTLACVERARVKREDAGLACAVPRSSALHRDPAVMAAERAAPRVQVVDLTNFFCDSRLCYPVVGGALVYLDYDHLTRVFATTLGPFLLREVRKLMASWH